MPQIIAVPDINVFVSGTTISQSYPGQVIVAGTTPVNVCQDPEDNALFSCAVEAKANYIVSGDEKHVLPIGSYKGVKTVSPREFVEEILTT